MRISARERTLLTVLCALLIFVLGMRFLVAPAYSRWQYRSAPQMLDNVAPQSVAPALLPKNLTKSANTEDMHRFFAGLAAETGLELDSISVTKSTIGLPVGVAIMTVNIAATAGQKEILRFMEAVESRDSAAVISGMDLAPMGAELSLHIVYSIYCDDSAVESVTQAPAENSGRVEGFQFGALYSGGDSSEG